MCNAISLIDVVEARDVIVHVLCETVVCTRSAEGPVYAGFPNVPLS